MNRILFDKSEIVDGVATFGGERAEHVLKVLHGEVGQILKTGEIGGLIGTSEIVAIEDGAIKVKVAHNDAPLSPWVDLILAPPRPRVMKRLLPQLATLGVGTIVLVGAKKVEKDFWGATLLKEEIYRPLLVDGLMQGCVATELPKIELRRNFRKFVNEEIDSMFPTAERIVAHPYDTGRAVSMKPPFVAGGPLCPPDARLLLAIGPEGGWTDDEVALLEAHAFRRHSLGSRILRTDTATIALISRFMP